MDGLPHSEARLEARRYKSSTFAADLLYLLRDDLRIKTWTSPNLEAKGVKIVKVAGSLTNAVFFASYPTAAGGVGPRTLLVRIYGPSSGSLISRPHELRTLHMLSSVYGIGPRVFGTFGNGRVEEYFQSSALTPEDLRDPQTSRWVARRMRELHRVDIEIVSGEEWNDPSLLAIRRNVSDWYAPATECLDLFTPESSIAADMDESHPWWRIKEEIDIERFYREWRAYLDWLKEWEKTHSVSNRVFAHNDTQYGNLLRLERPKDNIPNHHKIIVVDFEYAAPNVAAYDIANHFLEWTGDYRTDTPHKMNPDKYPTADQRRNFYRAYLSPAQPSTTNGPTPTTTPLMIPKNQSVSSLTPLSLGAPQFPIVASPSTLSSPSGVSTPTAASGANTYSPSADYPPTTPTTYSELHFPPPPAPASYLPPTSPTLRALRSKSSMPSIALDEAPEDSESSGAVNSADIDRLEQEVQAWTPAALAQWSIWGIVQARDDVLAGGVGEFDYLGYSLGRINAFREQLKLKGIEAPSA
ncbi:kinase-like protein [Clavulina sp. PMI_390]|nr:kinase-like protein [Clavulina sp. PMI_390]